MKQILETLSNIAKIVHPLEEYMMPPVYDKVTEEITTGHISNKQDILDAYTDLDVDSLYPFIKEVLEEKALNIAGSEMITPTGINWFKKQIGWGDTSKLLRFGNLYAKALDSSIKNVNLKNKNEVMKFVLRNEVLNTTLQQENSSKD